MNPTLKALYHSSYLPLVAIGLYGCSQIPLVDHARVGPFYQPSNFHSVGKLPNNVARVAVLPAACSIALTDEQLAKFDEIVLTTAGLTSRFEIVPVSRAQCKQLTGKNAVASTELLPFNFLAQLKDKYDVNAILFIDITSYSAYPPLRLGLRAKLATVTSGEILWAFDSVFTTSNPAVVNSARRYWLDTAPGNAPADFSNTALENPSKFATYVTSSAFETIPAH